jgi:hypothetical protein
MEIMCICSYVFGAFQKASVQDDCASERLPFILDPLSNTTSLVSLSLNKYCDCIPDWMLGDVYFEPLATLILAILAVVGYVIANRMSPLLQDVLGKLFNVTSEEELITRFGALPYHVQQDIQTMLKNVFGGEVPSVYFEIMTTEEDVGVNVEEDVAAEKEREHGDGCDISADSFVNIKLALRSLLVKEMQKNSDQSPAEAPTVSISTSDKMEHAEKMLQRMVNELVNQLRSNPDEAEIREASAVAPRLEDINSVKTKPRKTAARMSMLKKRGDRRDSLTSTEARMKESQHTANQKFIGWLKEDKLHRKAFYDEIVACQAELSEEAEQVDYAVILFMQLTLGLWVLLDYFAVQVWPSGSSWQCKWAYFSAVVMYKPFTVPMWLCLTVCCHYSFAHDLFKSKLSDPKTGTPKGAPFIRSKFTMAMVFLVAVMQLTWLVGTIVISLPLIMVFLPVVVLLAFFVPFLSLFIPQKCITFLKSAINLEGQLSHTMINEHVLKLVKPLSIEETVFSLKASTTQLVSVLILSFTFLPFYEEGFSRWLHYAGQFFNFALSLPKLHLMFSYTFSWPHFEQPRLSVQLALGVVVALIHLLFRIIKRILLNQAWLLNFERISSERFLTNKSNKAKSRFAYVEYWLTHIEEVGVAIFSTGTWVLFRRLTATTQASFDIATAYCHKLLSSSSATTTTETDKRSTARLLQLICLPFTFLFVWLCHCVKLVLKTPLIVLSESSEDNYLFQLCISEDAMAYGGIKVDEGCKVKPSVTFYALCKCPWLSYEDHVICEIFIHL